MTPANARSMRSAVQVLHGSKAVSAPLTSAVNTGIGISARRLARVAGVSSCRSLEGPVATISRRKYSSHGIQPCSLSSSSQSNPYLSARQAGSGYQISSQQQHRRHSTATSASPLARTPLYDLHVEHGAKFSPFAGFEMPLYYKDLSHAESHHWVREKCAVFDVSHMVQNTLHGPGAEAFLMQITPTSVNELSNYTSTLSVLLDPETGGIVDDTVITRLGSDSFYFVTNAGCRDGDAKFLKAELKKFSERDDRGLNWETLDDYGLIALQGPKAAEVLQRFTDSDLGTLTFGQCRSISLTLPNGTQTPELLVSRTGYTGEDGFEISIPVDNTPETADLPTKVTKALLQDTDTVRLAGLAARDSLRLEAGMCLYGHDISLLTTPPEASLTWVVSKARRSESSPSFNGASRILSQISSPKTMGRRRIGLDIEKGPPAREGAEIIDSETEKAVGVVTSGLPSPTLGGKNIAMALVDNGYHKKGTKLKVKIRKNVKDAEVVKLPFVENKFYRG